jgi:hypothetical protein
LKAADQLLYVSQMTAAARKNPYSRPVSATSADKLLVAIAKA